MQAMFMKRKKKEPFRNGTTHSLAMTQKSFRCKTLNPTVKSFSEGEGESWKKTINLTP